MAMIKEHGGSIEAQNVEGSGALFQITLPVAPTSAPQPTASPSKPAAPQPSAALQGRLALVVDDEASIRELIQSGLTAHGVNVECAGSGEEAFEHMQQGKPYDFILCDVKMPGLSGDQLYQRLISQDPSRRETLQKRFVFMTGDLVDVSTSSFLDSAGVRCVQKPFRMTDLARILSETLSAPALK
jgi:CheY-like chemotaxis protein